MLTNNEIKRINSLSRKRERLAQKLFLVEGDKNVAEVVQSSFEVSHIYGIDDTFSAHRSFTKVSPKQLERISQYKTATEALALVKIPEDPAIDYSTPSLLLEDINDPGNLGTIIRTADWFGITQIICSPNSVDCFNPKVVSATKGSLFRTNIHYMSLTDFVKRSDLRTIATSLNGVDLSSKSDLTSAHLAFGSESHGISKELEDLCEWAIKIPSFNSQAESLNIAISVGVVCGFIHLNVK